jgi:hypothetical protein
MKRNYPPRQSHAKMAAIAGQACLIGAGFVRELGEPERLKRMEHIAGIAYN